MSSAAKVRSLSGGNQWLLIRVFLVLIVYKCLLLLFPFRWFYKRAPRPPYSGRVLPEKNITGTIWAIQVLSNQIPFGFTCLVQSLSAKWLLKRCPDVRIYIGVRKVNQAFSAHAWVVYKGKTILGEQPNQVFEPILDWS